MSWRRFVDLWQLELISVASFAAVKAQMLGGIPVVGDAAGLAGGAASKAAELGGSVVGTLGSLKGKAMESSILKDGVGGTFYDGSCRMFHCCSAQCVYLRILY